MRFYRVAYFDWDGEHRGYGWFTSHRDANRDARSYERRNEDCDAHVGEVDIMPTKAGILSALNRYASHEDNG